jgi:hypothetical protein
LLAAERRPLALKLRMRMRLRHEKRWPSVAENHRHRGH